MSVELRRPAPLPPPSSLRVEPWGDVPGLVHGFFGRAGGVGQGELGGLNVSDRVGDADAHVAANWNLVRQALPGLAFARMQQVHGTRVVQVSSADQDVGEADGLITNRAGVGLTVLTADCVPILGVASGAGAVMAVHAGWRGSLAGVVATALTAAREAFGIPATAWRIALGPSVGGCCYEVEAELGARFVQRWGSMPDAWQPAATRGKLDLRRVNMGILIEQGVAAERISSVGPCTACASAEYFSHRRSAGRAGRQVSAIGFSAA
ncbi:MAG: peptidoglycan editing factor PgeF [bacterium]